VKTDRISLTTN